MVTLYLLNFHSYPRTLVRASRCHNDRRHTRGDLRVRKSWQSWLIIEETYSSGQQGCFPMNHNVLDVDGLPPRAGWQFYRFIFGSGSAGSISCVGYGHCPPVGYHDRWRWRAGNTVLRRLAAWSWRSFSFISGELFVGVKHLGGISQQRWGSKRRRRREERLLLSHTHLSRVGLLFFDFFLGRYGVSIQLL